MKKVQIVLGILCIATMSAVAQIKVDAYGDVHIGSTTITPYDTQGDLIIGQDGLNNSLTFYDGTNTYPSLRIFRGTDPRYGYVIRGDVWSNGLILDVNGNMGLGKYPTSTYVESGVTKTYRLDVSGRALASLWAVPSDKHIKKNIHPIIYTNTVYDSLIPYSYNYLKTYQIPDSLSAIGFRTIISDTCETNFNFGFLAQDVQKYFPELVLQGLDSLLAINYDGFIPILWKSNAELRHTISTLENRIAQLEHGNGNGHLKSEPVTDQQTGTPLQTTILHQNFPNPWNTSTEITMDLDRNITNAMLCIYDLTGKQIKCYTITSRGETQVTIHAEELQPGMYIYSLIADGLLIDTKKMVLTE